MTSEQLGRKLVELKRSGNLTTGEARSLVEAAAGEQERLDSLLALQKLAESLAYTCRMAASATDEKTRKWCDKDIKRIAKEIYKCLKLP